MSQFTNIFRDGSRNESIKDLKALTNLNEGGDSNVCHPSFVRTRNNGVIYSECDRKAWSQYDLQNEKSHMTHFIVNRFGKFQKSVRVLYIVLKFLKNLFVKVKPTKYINHFDNLSDFMGRSSFILSFLIVLNKHHQSTELFAPRCRLQ